MGELGPAAPTLLAGWTARDLAAHLVLPGPFRRFAERRAFGASAVVPSTTFEDDRCARRPAMT